MVANHPVGAPLLHADSSIDVENLLTCRVVDSEADFYGIESVWREVSKDVFHASPMLEWPWLRVWWETFGRKQPGSGLPGRPYVVIVEEEGRPVAVFPFVEYAYPTWSFRLRRLLPMGYAGNLEPSGLTEEPMVASRPGFEERARRLVVHLVEERIARGRVDCAIVRQLERSEEPQWILSPRSFRGIKVKPGPQVVEMPENWSLFQKWLSKSMRDNLKYYPRLLTRDGHSHEIEVCREPVLIPGAVDRLIDLHKRRVWSERRNGRRDYFAGAAQKEMLASGLAALAKEKGAFVAFLIVDGKDVAAQAFVESNNCLLAHYSGFDPEFSKYSPLLVLQEAILRGALERGTHNIDLLFGNAPWQKRWGASHQTHEVRTLILSRRPTALARAAIYFIAKEVAIFLKRRVLPKWTARSSSFVGSISSFGMELHLLAARVASSSLLTHHLSRIHR